MSKMIKKVEESLLQLEQEFANLKSLVAYLDLAKEVVVENQNLTESFKMVKEKSDVLFNSVSDLLNEVKDLNLPEFENRLQEKFSSLGDNFAIVANQFNQGITKLGNDTNSSFEKTESALSELVVKFDSVDFAKRLEKADDALFTIQQSIINNQTRIESFERNIKDEFDYKIKDVMSQLEKINSEFSRISESIEQKITQKSSEIIQLNETSKQQSKTQFIVLLSLVIICILLGALGFVLR